VEQVELALLGGDVGRVGQAGGRVLGGEAGDVVGRLHRAFQRGTRKVGGAGVAAALAQVDRHAQRLVAVCSTVSSSPRARSPTGPALGGFGAGIGGAQLLAWAMAASTSASKWARE
jgi:hypothetical protein